MDSNINTEKQYKQFFIRLPLYLMQALLSKGVWRVRWWCFEHSIPWTKKKNSQQRFTGWVDQSRCLFSHGVQQWAVEKNLCLTVCNCGGQANNLHQWIDDSDVNDLFPHECKVAYCCKFKVSDAGYFKGAYDEVLGIVPPKWAHLEKFYNWNRGWGGKGGRGLVGDR